MDANHLPVSVVRTRGVIYFDTSSRGGGRYYHKWCAEITLAGVRFRKRSNDKTELVRWVSAVRAQFACLVRDSTNSYDQVNKKLKAMRPVVKKL